MVGVHGLSIEKVLGVEGKSRPEELCVFVGLGKGVLDELAYVDSVGIGLVETLSKGNGFSLQFCDVFSEAHYLAVVTFF